MGKFDKREGSIYHVDAPDGHRYFIISDREFTDCGKASESSYANKRCHCDACMDDHTERNRKRKEAYARLAAATRRRRQEKAERQRPVSPPNVRHNY